jgi:hypothetical protein
MAGYQKLYAAPMEKSVSVSKKRSTPACPRRWARKAFYAD